jgi:hypothetical protein
MHEFKKVGFGTKMHQDGKLLSSIVIHFCWQISSICGIADPRLLTLLALTGGPALESFLHRRVPETALRIRAGFIETIFRTRCDEWGFRVEDVVHAKRERCLV